MFSFSMTPIRSRPLLRNEGSDTCWLSFQHVTPDFGLKHLLKWLHLKKKKEEKNASCVNWSWCLILAICESSVSVLCKSQLFFKKPKKEAGEGITVYNIYSFGVVTVEKILSRWVNCNHTTIKTWNTIHTVLLFITTCIKLYTLKYLYVTCFN